MLSGSSAFVVSSFRISSFGINPERGGRPLNESSASSVRAVIIGELVQVVPRCVIVLVVEALSEENMVAVIAV